MHADADRQRPFDVPHLGLQGLAELQEVSALRHGDAEADRRLAVDSEHRIRGVFVPPRDGGDVAQPKETIVHAQVHGAQTVLGGELSADANRDLFGARLDDA